MYYFSLFRPEEWDIVYTIYKINLFRIFHRVLVSFFFVATFFIWKSQFMWWDFIGFSFFVVFFYIMMLVFSEQFSAILITNLSKKDEKFSIELQENTLRIQSIIELGLSPFIFFFHAGVISNYLQAYGLLVLGFVLILSWVFYNWIVAIQSFLGLSFNTVSRILVLGFLKLFALPLLLFFFLFLLILFISK
ncbi:MAG: hypothetical protein NZ853_07745 [Leptospiraceae bacterium]|nr:hypothetical protein [Leptospiraceae bacterium]